MAPTPHPLAGKSGLGPPLAPANWKWRAGNRLTDMYFYSPSGKQIRSRTELATFLATMNDPPPAEEFCWRVTEEGEGCISSFFGLELGSCHVCPSLVEVSAYLICRVSLSSSCEVLKNNHVQLAEPAPKKPSGSKNPSKKRKASVSDAEEIGRKKSKTDSHLISKASTSAVQTKSEEPLPARPPKMRGYFASTLSRPRGVKVKAKKDLNGRGGAPRTFRNILSVKSSFKWLYDSKTLETFLEEAARLNEKSVTEVSEMRKVLLERNLDMSNITKYPNSVLRVFVQLLRNKEAPTNLGKVELADLCVNWRCKKRHYWCLLETSRLSPKRPLKVEEFSKLERSEQRTQSSSFVLAADVQNAESMQIGVECSVEPEINSQKSEPEASGESTRNVDNSLNREEEDKLKEPSVMLNDGPQAEVSHFQAAEAAAMSPQRRMLAGAEETTISHSSEDLYTRDFGDIAKIGKEAETEGPRRDIVAKSIPGKDKCDLTDPAEGDVPTNSELDVPKSVLHQEWKTVSPEDNLKPEVKGEVSCRQHDEKMLENVECTLEGFRSEENSGSQTTKGLIQFSEGEGVISMMPEISVLPGQLDLNVRDGEVGAVMEGTWGESESVSKLQEKDQECWSHERSVITGDSGGSRFDAVMSEAGNEGAPGSKVLSTSVNNGGELMVTDATTDINEAVKIIADGETEVLSAKLDAKSNEGMTACETMFAVEIEDEGVVVISRSTVMSGGVGAQRGMHTDKQILKTCSFSQNEGYETRGQHIGSDTNLEGLTDQRVKDIMGERTEEPAGQENYEGRFASAQSCHSGVRESSVCWCKICDQDLSFCRGCMCSICRKSLQPQEEWLVVKCTCKHVCHIECVWAAKGDSIVKDLAIDGDLSCPSCSRKVNLLPFFQKKVEHLLSVSKDSNMNIQALEKLLREAADLLKGTENGKYRILCGLVAESYELLSKCSVFPQVQLLLKKIQDELIATLHSGDEQISGDSSDPSAQGRDWVIKQKLSEEALQALSRERLEMEQFLTKFSRAYQGVLDQIEDSGTTHASLPVLKEQVRSLNDKFNPVVSIEQIENQRCKVDSEMQKLWELQRSPIGEANSLTLNEVDSCTSTWLERLKLQRTAVDLMNTELLRLESLYNQVC